MTVVPPANIAAHMATELDGRSSSVFLVLSGPGGTGKSTLIRMWRKADPDLGYVKNVTTRSRRPPDPISGVNDDDFFDFVSRDQFRELVLQGELAQWVNPQEGYYSGTPRQPLLDAIEQRRDLVFDYTPQLYLNLQRAFPQNVVGVFVAPPSMEVLRDRLAARSSEHGNRLQLKFNMGAQDMSYVDMHRYHVTNHDLEETLGMLQSILRAEKQRLNRFPELCDLYDTMKDRRQMLFYYDPTGSRIDGI
jgi:guanylate kinase